MIIGVDEVGRGCWAGPLVAAAVMIDENLGLNSFKLNDSKKVPKKQRALIAIKVYEHAKVGIGWVSAEAIDKIGLTEANRQAMLFAVKQLNYALASKIIIDGNINYLTGHICAGSIHCRVEPCKMCARAETRVGADATVSAVSAASIVAKVARDNFMAEQALLYRNYGFEKHVGYGTKLHAEQLLKHGVTLLHRKSYKPIKALL